MKKEELLQQVVARERGIAIEKVQHTFGYLTIRDQLDEGNWEEEVPFGSERQVTERLEGKVRSFLAKWGDQMGKF